MFWVQLCFAIIGVSAIAQTPFRLSLSESPKSFDPSQLRSSAGQYVSQQLYRHFYRLNENNHYVPELGDHCDKKPLRWVCHLKSNLKWSDGQYLTAADFVKSYQHFLTLPSPRADLLFAIQNAQEVFDKKLPPDKLGIKALTKSSFEILWTRDSGDKDFILMSPLFVPLPGGESKKDVFSGPYAITEQTPTKLSMKPNPYYYKKNSRPPLEWLMYEETLAVQAFDKNELDFLRRIPTSLIPKFKDKPGFFWVPVFRLDYVAFGPSLKDEIGLRRKLTHTLNYAEMQKLYNSPNLPGCVGLPLDFYSGDELCYEFQSKKEDLLQRPLQYTYSSLGGEDHRRLAEWLQSQWRTMLNLNLNVKGLENKIFLEDLKKSAPDLFRRGLSPENPTCFGALESFLKGNPDNWIHFDNKEFETYVRRLPQALAHNQKKICRKALDILLQSYVLIPTGRIHFAMMVNPIWEGLSVNSLNHLDLSELKLKANSANKSTTPTTISK